ncbi:MAG: GtrA family protein [Bacteroidales bacterium]|nr:GtrA family protein [Bacteroidales bacterium]
MKHLTEILKKLYMKYRNFILYGLIGCINTGVDFGIFALLRMPQIDLHYLIANIISYHCGMVCSFFLNRRYNFKVTDRPIHRFMSFYAISLIAVAASEGLLFLLVSGCAMDDIWAKFISMIIIAVLQFLFVKHFTFKK